MWQSDLKYPREGSSWDHYCHFPWKTYQSDCGGIFALWCRQLQRFIGAIDPPHFSDHIPLSLFFPPPVICISFLPHVTFLSISQNPPPPPPPLLYLSASPTCTHWNARRSLSSDCCPSTSIIPPSLCVNHLSLFANPPSVHTGATRLESFTDITPLLSLSLFSLSVSPPASLHLSPRWVGCWLRVEKGG